MFSQVSKMIITEELMASLDQPSQCIVMHRSEPSRLQSIALQLSDKVGMIPLTDFYSFFLAGESTGGEQ